MVVTAHYSNAADETITNYTYSEEPLTVEDKTVTISWNGQTATVAITVVAPKGSTVNNPLSVSEAITKFSSLPSSETDSTKCWSSSRFFIQGKVKGYAASSSNKYTLVDTTDNTKEFIVYKSALPQDFTRAVINDIVVMEGFIENFKGTLEMTSYTDGTHDALPTTAAIIERGTSTVSLDSSSSANADVTFESTATNASSYSFTVAAKEGYQISSVKVNDTVVEGKEGTYTVDVVLGTMKILVETIAAGQKLPTTLTFNVTNYVTDNSIETSKDKLTSIDLDSVITASVTGSGNTGQFFGTTTNDWRIYAVGSLTITAASGYTIKTVKVTFATGNTATIKIGEKEVSSKEVITVNGTEVVYSLTNGGTKTAQMKVQEIEVVYVEN